jgi:hypothetical protein
MIKVTNQFTRPNLDTPFHTSKMTPELFEHFKTTYRDTGKLLSVKVFNSEDSLTMTSEWVWNTQEDLDQFRADAKAIGWNSVKNSHNTENLISSTPTLKAQVTEI